MQNRINVLAQNLNLSLYQSNKLKTNYEQYNISRLVKRGGVLFAPYNMPGFFGWIGRVLFGVRADLIGENKILLQGMRKIKFCANGYHCVRVGRHIYYADASGNVVSRGEFIENTRC